MLQIYCKNNNLTKDFPEGSTLLDIYNGFNLEMPYGPVSAKVNNKVEGLNFKVYYNKDVEFLDITNPSGMRTYFRSLCFILVKAVEELYPQGSISLEHPVSKGYYCTLHLDRSIGLDDVTRIKQKMQEIITDNIPFQRIECHTEQAVELFTQRGMMDKAKLLKTSGQLYTFYYRLGDTIDYYYGSLVPSTGYIKLFDIVKYYDGLLLRIPNRKNPQKLEELVKQEKMRISGISPLEPDIGNQYGWGFQHSLQQRACYRPDKCIGSIARKENCTYSRRNHSPEPKWRKSETGIDFRTVIFGKDNVQQTSQYSVND